MTLNLESQEKLSSYFRNLADLELNVETYRQKLAALFDFEPYAAFSTIDQDGNCRITTQEIFNFLR